MFLRAGSRLQSRVSSLHGARNTGGVPTTPPAARVEAESQAPSSWPTSRLPRPCFAKHALNKTGSKDVGGQGKAIGPDKFPGVTAVTHPRRVTLSPQPPLLSSGGTGVHSQWGVEPARPDPSPTPCCVPCKPPPPPLCISRTCTFQSSCGLKRPPGEPSQPGPPRDIALLWIRGKFTGAPALPSCTPVGACASLSPAPRGPQTLPSAPHLPGGRGKVGGRPLSRGHELPGVLMDCHVPPELRTATRKGVGTQPLQLLPPAQVTENQAPVSQRSSPRTPRGADRGPALRRPWRAGVGKGSACAGPPE